MDRRNRARAEIGRVGDVDDDSLRARVAGDGGIDVRPIGSGDDEIHVGELHPAVLLARQTHAGIRAREVIDPRINRRRDDMDARAGIGERLRSAERHSAAAHDQRRNRRAIERHGKRAHKNWPEAGLTTRNAT